MSYNECGSKFQVKYNLIYLNPFKGVLKHNHIIKISTLNSDFLNVNFQMLQAMLINYEKCF